MRILVATVLLLLAVSLRAAGPSPEAQATLVVFNKADPVSGELANYYAVKRGIPLEQVVGLDCPLTETISREEYDRTLAEPLRKIFSERGWWEVAEREGQRRTERNKIHFVALIRGIPLKIAPAAGYPGDSANGPAQVAGRNEAAVDSELATLGLFSSSISGALRNPYFRSFVPIRDAGLTPLMLVCRLDGPTPLVVQRMIDDSIAAERAGLAGFAYIDTRNIKEGGYAEGDKWLLKIAGNAHRNGIPVILDSGPQLFPANYPVTQAAFYYGWYSEHADGPFAKPGFKFNPGAIAYHIHSFSADTLRDPRKNWVGPLLTAGAAASMGNVYEPLLSLTPQPDIFHERIQSGFTFAESAYMSIRILSWVNTFVGDPLYRPLRNRAFDDAPEEITPWTLYRDGAREWFSKERAAGRVTLRQSAKQLNSGVILEGLALLEASAGEIPASLAALEAARKAYGTGPDGVRTITHAVNLMRANGRTKEALALVRSQQKLEPSAMLRDLELELDPPPPPSPKR